MRIKMAAIAAGVMLAAAGCAATEPVTVPAPPTVAASPAPSATPSDVLEAYDAVADLAAAEQGVMGPDPDAAVVFVYRWWDSQTVPEQVAVCRKWNGNVQRVIRDDVDPTWGSTTGRWDATTVRMELSRLLDRLCL